MRTMLLTLLLGVMVCNVNAGNVRMQGLCSEYITTVRGTVQGGRSIEGKEPSAGDKPQMIDLSADYMPEDIYPPALKRKLAPPNTAYYVDPVKGDNNADGLSSKSAWRTFKPVNNLLFTSGNTVNIIAPGSFFETLMPMTKGTPQKPLIIRFAPGRYDIFPASLLKRKFHISNTNDDPEGLKAVSFYIKNSDNIRIEGQDSSFFMRGKMIEVCVDHSSNISFKGLNFDYKRPTVSEFRVQTLGRGFADIAIHKDSVYEIRNGKLYWIGEGWEYRAGGYGQRLNLETNVLRRSGSPLGHITKAEEVKPFLVRVYWGKKNPGFEKGIVYQARGTRRDCAGVFQERSSNILWENCNFNFLHGMGVVSQFCRNITFKNMRFAPQKGGGRTCAAWADILHFSGCAGQINVFNVFFSGANDDAINVHGTHLRITQRVSARQIKVRYMHGQSYGFEQYQPGDEIDFIRTEYMTPYASNIVQAVERLDDKEILLTLKKDTPVDIEKIDVIENRTWTAALHVKNCIVERIPTRGFLITTRRKVVIEKTLFWTPAVGILCEDDARGWYESGVIRDMTIKNCIFFDCGIVISPKAREAGEHGVHKNIVIKDNSFYLNNYNIVSANYTENITVSNNTIYTTDRNKAEGDANKRVHFSRSRKTDSSNNRYEFIKKFPAEEAVIKLILMQ